ncbi:Cytochrome P450 [Pyrenophora tritici-repentis]|nr:Cytochrome P450 [Pyrenophora tritici-repentis]
MKPTSTIDTEHHSLLHWVQEAVSDETTRMVAFMKMRLILTLPILNFDFSLANPKESRADQELYVTWKDKPLWLKLVSRK